MVQNPEMARETTHANLLDAAQALVMHQGFAATTVDQVIERAGVTKGAFFYHFATKEALAHALVARWAERDRAQLDEVMARAEALSKDPAQRVLILVGLLAEFADTTLPSEDPGCLYACLCYEAKPFDETVRQEILSTFGYWHERLTPWFDAALAGKAPIEGVGAAELLALLDTIFEGALVLARIQRDHRELGRQLRQYRTYLELLFAR